MNKNSLHLLYAILLFAWVIYILYSTTNESPIPKEWFDQLKIVVFISLGIYNIYKWRTKRETK